MVVLTTDNLVGLRQTLAKDEHPSWSKGEINVVFQEVEDMLGILGFSASMFVTEITKTNIDARTVQDAVIAGTIAVNILPVIEGWLESNPPSVIKRSIDNQAIAVWIIDNISSFTVLDVMPTEIRVKTLRSLIEWHVEAAV